MKVLLVSEGKHEADGALLRFLERLAPGSFQCDLERLSRQDIHAHHGKGKGYLKRAVRWMLEAQRRGYKGLILVVDEDGQPARRSEIDEAQHSDLTSIPRALGVAVRTFDAWFLADERALSSVLATIVHRQPDPESIKDPKSICQSMLNEHQPMMSLAVFYASLADTIEIESLCHRCPRGFSPFADRIKQMNASTDARPG